VQIDELKNKHLIAYLVKKHNVEDRNEIEKINQLLSKSLPAYMIPNKFILLDEFPLTSHGKIDRILLSTIKEEQTKLKSVIEPISDVEKKLAVIWSELLQVDKVGLNDDFFKSGGDSIITLQFVSKARQLGIELDVKQIFKTPTLRELSASAKKTQNVIITPDQPFMDQSPLTPIQHWFFEQNFQEKNHFNQAIILKTNKNIKVNLLKEVVKIILENHDSLRSRFKYEDQEWKQEYLQLEDIEIDKVVTLIDLRLLSKDDQAKTIEEVSTSVQRDLDIGKGNVLRIVLFRCDQEHEAKLLIVIHHLVVDVVSWRILLEDLELIYEQLEKGSSINLLGKSPSYGTWAQTLNIFAQSDIITSQLNYWLDSIPIPTQALPVDFNIDSNRYDLLQDITVSLTLEESEKLLRDIPKFCHFQPNELLLTALVQAIGDWTGQYSISVAVEGHGREEIKEGIDLSRTIGWLTSLYPVCINLKAPNELGISLEDVKYQINSIPLKGIGYGMLRYISQFKDAQKLKNFPFPEVAFNYLGRWIVGSSKDNLFSFSNENIGKSIGNLNSRPYKLEFNSQVIGNQLQITLSFNASQFALGTLEDLLNNLKLRIQELIIYCFTEELFEKKNKDSSLIQLSREYQLYKENRKIGTESVYSLSEASGKPKLFLIHSAGGLAFSYIGLTHHLKNYSIYGINNPNFGNSTNAFNSIEEMASHYIRMIKEIQNKGPYRLGGWSFGGLVSFEMARQLAAEREMVDVVILIDSLNLSLSKGYIQSKNLEDFLKERKVDPYSKEGVNLKHEMLNNRKISMNYKPKLYHGRVVLIKAQTEDELEVYREAYNGWRGFIDPTLEIYSVPGAHDNLLDQKNVKLVAKKIDYILTIPSVLNTILKDKTIGELERQLRHAIQHNDYFLIEKILVSGVNIMARDAYGKTVLDIAKSTKKKDLIELLEKNILATW